jgi:hypothetical protein
MPLLSEVAVALHVLYVVFRKEQPPPATCQPSVLLLFWPPVFPFLKTVSLLQSLRTLGNKMSTICNTLYPSSFVDALRGPSHHRASSSKAVYSLIDVEPSAEHVLERDLILLLELCHHLYF